MTEKYIIIPGKPIPKARHRTDRRGRTYDPQSSKKKQTKRFLGAVWKPAPIEGPIEIEIIFYMPIPKATSKKKRVLMIENEIKHTKKSDIDNLEKYALDCMNTIVYVDDSQVWDLHARKRYGETPRTEIIIRY